MAVSINMLITGSMGVGTSSSAPSEPTAPDGKVLYKTSADGEWLESKATIVSGVFWGFTEIKSAVAVIIPSKDANGNDVTKIAEKDFQDCTSLTSVTIPLTVTRIDNYAFRYCSGLKSVTMPDYLISMGAYVFNYCNSLTSVTIVATGNPDANAENVKQMMIYAIGSASISNNITWNMPS